MSEYSNPSRTDCDWSDNPPHDDSGERHYVARRLELPAWRTTRGHVAWHAVRELFNTGAGQPRWRTMRFAVVIVSLLGGHHAAAQTKSADPSSSARDLEHAADVGKRADNAFNAGVAAYRRGDYASAREDFAQAYQLDPSYRAAAVLGQTEEKLGNLAQAATLLNWALFHLDEHVEPEAKSRMDADLALLRNRVLTLRLVTEVPFQEVLIDDLLFTTSSVRLLPEGNNTWTIYLDPASHQVVVRSEGYAQQERRVSAPAGTSLDWQLEWKRVGPPSDAPSEPVAPPERKPPNRHAVSADTGKGTAGPAEWQLPMAIASGGLALVGAGFGIYSLHQYSRASRDFDDAKRNLIATDLAEPCGRDASLSTSPICSAMATASDTRVTYGNRATVALSAAGALALSSAVFWVWWAATGDSDVAQWTVSPVVDAAHWGGAVGGRF